MRGFTHPSPPCPGSGPWQWGHTGTSPHSDCRLPCSHWSMTSQPPRTRRVLQLLLRAAPGTAGLWVLAHPPVPGVSLGSSLHLSEPAFWSTNGDMNLDTSTPQPPGLLVELRRDPCTAPGTREVPVQCRGPCTFLPLYMKLPDRLDLLSPRLNW